MRSPACPGGLPVLLLGLVTAALAYATGVAASRRLGSRIASFVALLEVVAACRVRLAAAPAAARGGAVGRRPADHRRRGDRQDGRPCLSRSAHHGRRRRVVAPGARFPAIAPRADTGVHLFDTNGRRVLSRVPPSSTTLTPSSAPPRPTCPARMVWPPRGGGPSRRSATRTRAPPRRWAWSRACAYSGAYPTGYGRYAKNTEGVPEEMFDRLQASGFTHFQQSGTGAIRKYYNYVRVTPMVQPLDDARRSPGRCTTRWPRPGYYAATLDTGVRCEITVGAKVAVHRYTFPEHRSARVVVDLSCGGLAIDLGRTVPLRAQVESMGHGRAQGTVVMEGVPLSVHLEADTPGLAADALVRPAAHRRAAPGSTSTASGTPRCGRSACCSWARPGPGRRSRCGWASRCAAASRPGENLRTRVRRRTSPAFDAVALADPGPLARAPRTGSRSRAARRPAARCSATALYHSLIKPCFADDESPFWPDVRPVRVRRLHDVGHLQDPAAAARRDRPGPGHRPAGVADPGLRGGGQLPDRLPDGPRRRPVLPAGQRARAHRAGRRARARAGPAWTGTGRSCTWSTTCAGCTARTSSSTASCTRSRTPSTSRTPTTAPPRSPGRSTTAASPTTSSARGRRWVNAFDPATGLLRDSEFYEGGKWNYSFRLLHDMAARIALAGGDDGVHRHARPLLRLRRRRRSPSPAGARTRPRWPPATR